MGLLLQQSVNDKVCVKGKTVLLARARMSKIEVGHNNCCGGHPLPNIDFVLCMFCQSLPIGSTCCHSVRINVMKIWY